MISNSERVKMMKTAFVKSIALFGALVSTFAFAATESVPRPTGLVDLTSPTGRASSSVTFYKGSAARAFQDNANIASGGDGVRIIYLKATSGNDPAQFAYTFDAATVVNAYGVGIMNANTQYEARNPHCFKFYGSNDYDGNKANLASATWTLLDTKSNETAWSWGEYRYYEFNNSTAYTSYMLAIETTDLNTDNYVQFAYLEFFNNDLVEFSGGSLTRTEDAWDVEATVKSLSGNAYLDLQAGNDAPVTFNLGVINVSTPASRTLTASDLAQLDGTAYYKATLRTISASGQESRKGLPSLYYFGEYASASPSSFAKKFAISVPAQATSEIGTDIAVQFTLSPSAISGFNYGDFSQNDYSDLLFTDSYGHVLAHEVAVWDTTGESKVWVKIPKLTGGTVIYCYYGGPSVSIPSGHVWPQYTGVWHLDGVSGADNNTYKNSSFLGSAADGTKANASTAGATGKFGSSCYICSAGTKADGCHSGGVFVPHLSELGVGATFTVSGWFKHKNQSYYYDKMFAKRVKDGTNGFFVRHANGWTTGGQPECNAGSLVSPKIAWPDTMCSDWGYCVFVFDGVSIKVYQNGELLWDKTATVAVTDNTDTFTIGNSSLNSVDSVGGDCAWCGWADEVRLAGGVALSAEEIAWDYAVAAHPELFVYNPVQDNASAPTIVITDNKDDFGNVSPAFGSYNSNTFTSGNCTSLVSFADGLCYVADSYTIEESADEGVTWSAPVVHNGTSYDFTYDGAYVRLTWLWRAVAAKVDVATSFDSQSITFSKAADYTDGDGGKYYVVGEPLTITCADPDATSFREWYGTKEGVSVADNVCTVTPGTVPVSLQSVTRHAWTYANKVLTDGSWILAAKKESNGSITITGVTDSADYGVIDFTDGITESGNPVMLKKIDNSVFKENVDLRAMTLPDGFESLGWYAFQNCTSLETFDRFPDTLTGFGGQTFDGCTNLTGALTCLSPSATSIGNKTFAKTRITSINLPYVTDLSGGSAFEYNAALTNAIIPAIEKIGARTFRGCTALKEVMLGDSLTTLGLEAFVECSGLERVIPMLPDSLTTFGTSLYNGTYNNGAFNGCSKLKIDVRMANPAVKDIYGQIFQNCGITSCYAPYATNVWKYAFNNVANLTNITFGAESVKMNSYYPIYGNPNTLEIHFPGKAPVADFSGGRAFGSQNYIKIFANNAKDPVGWSEVMASDWFVALEPADKLLPSYPGKRALGFLISPTGSNPQSGSKCWLIDTSTRGFIILVK